MLKIGSLTLQNPLVLAPMSGYTDTCHRRLARRFGAALVYSEMISAAGLSRRDPRSLSMILFHPEEQPYGVQIFGSDPSEMAEAAVIAQGEGASLVDINLGCPVKKVCRTGAGAALLLEPQRLAQILRAVRKSITCPLTVKMRLGWDQKHHSFPEIARIAEDIGVDAIILHPRTRAQGFRGHADWSHLVRLKDERNIPVIGSGDLSCPEHCLQALSTGLSDGVMIGRASRGSPWIFSQVLDLLSGREPRRFSARMRYGAITLHMEWLMTRFGREHGLRRMRFLLFHYIRRTPQAAAVRARLARIVGEEELGRLLRGYFLHSRRDGPSATSG
jgi:nifR3 family TIM-barrel protein